MRPLHWSDARTRWVILAMAIALRAAYAIAIHGTSFAESLHCDNARYDEQSDGILRGDHDLETQLFITAPLYSYLQAAFKWSFGAHWLPAISLFQLLMSALSVVALWSIARDLFDRRVALVAAAAYCVYPPTLLWVVNPAQETLFQCFLLFFVRAYLDVLARPSVPNTLRAATLFAITFLTKSHILLFTPFLLLHWWWVAGGAALSRGARIGFFLLVCGLFTLPYGLLNLRLHGMYVISSTGQGGHFLTGHNDDTYLYIVDPPPLGSAEHRRIHHMDYLVLRELADTLDVLPHKADQALMLETGLRWCADNPGRFALLTLYDFAYFLLPGVNPNHYPFGKWAAMFALALPVYLLAYAGLWMALRERFRTHGWMLGIWLAMVIFSCVFFVQNRFRTITLEPLYLAYASFALLRLAHRLFRGRVGFVRDPIAAAEWPSRDNGQVTHG